MKILTVFAAGCVLITTVGCVTQHTYDKTRAEADELNRALELSRIDVKEMEMRTEALQTWNKKEEATAVETRAAIQRELEALALMHQQADDKIAALQTQIAHLINQSRLLNREIADAKQESTSLQAMVTQFKKELEESRFTSVPMPPMKPMPPNPSPDPTALAPVVPTPTPQPPAPQQAQSDPTPLKKHPGAARTSKGEPAQTDDSWTGMLMNWVSSLWGWIFG